MDIIMDDILDNKIFKLINNNEFTELESLLKNNENINLDIQDKNYNYLIDYLILYDQNHLIDFILNNRKIRLDILTSDNKTLLYNIIKFNKTEILKLLLKFDKTNIGVSILNKKDDKGENGLFYCCIYNNFDMLKILFNDNDIYLSDNENNSFLLMLLKYERTDMLLYILEKTIKTNNSILILIKSNSNETLLQSAIIYENVTIINYLLDLNLNSEFLNNQEDDYGLTCLHHSLIIKNIDLTIKLLKNKININSRDYLGNSPLHYCITENIINILLHILTIDKLQFNVINLNGDTPLHLFLKKDEIQPYILDDETIQSKNYKQILLTLLKNTPLNLQNNDGYTSLYFLVEKKFWKYEEIKKILTNGKRKMNIFINNILSLIDNNQKDEFINLVVESYYNNLKQNKQVYIDWEIYCANDNLSELIKLLRKKGDKNIEYYCKEKIKNIIVNEKRSIPLITKINLEVENGIYKKGCYYTGSTIDIIFGLVFLYKKFPNIVLVLDYPLTLNKNLVDYYKKMGINYSFKLDFSNIEIIWVYQKLILPQNFDSIFMNKIQNLSENNNFIVIPIGIETDNGSHANILIIDIKRKLIERFEPNGYFSPREFYFNSDLLDEILKNKFSNLIPSYKYVKPSEYLPVIGLQILETLENDKCKKLGDPNGFCAVWCVWWVYYKCKYDLITSDKLIKLLINKIKFINTSFKNIIRNFSQYITEIRDNSLYKYNIDINDWMNNNYSEELLDNLEKDILEFIR
jgi:hypothetical protein